MTNLTLEQQKEVYEWVKNRLKISAIVAIILGIILQIVLNDESPGFLILIKEIVQLSPLAFLIGYFLIPFKIRKLR